MSLDRPPPERALTRERLELLRQLEDWLDTPMLLLAFAWLVLLVMKLVWGLTPLLETIARPSGPSSYWTSPYGSP
jgi:voltage-gated potassium channel